MCVSQDVWTALHLAAQEGKVDVARELIKAGAKINLQTVVTAILHYELLLALKFQGT